MSFEGAKEFKAPQPYIRNKLDPILAIERRWKLYDGRRACTPMDIREFGLSLHKAPPPIPDWRYYTAPPRGADIAGASKASKAADTPPVTAQPTYCFFDSAPAREARQLEPFNLYDLPAAMRAEDFPIAAQFAERWLNSRRFDAHWYDFKKGTYVEGRYDPDMIDTHTIRLKWLFRFGNVESKFNRLLQKIDTPNARSVLRAILLRHVDARPAFSGSINTMTICQNDLQKLHADFQFQYESVSMLDAMVPAPASKGTWLPIGMTDVSAALGNFNFYAVIARAFVERTPRSLPANSPGSGGCVQRTATVTHVYAYMRDTYSFHDKGTTSQYLGHWNKRGMILLPAAAVAHFVAEGLGSRLPTGWQLEADDMAMLPVTVKDQLASEYVYYPVRNRDFRAWQAQHQRGGDFLVYSDIRHLALREPIRIDLGIEC